MPKHIAVYCRVSSKTQDHRSQKGDLQAWANAQKRLPVVWYTDKFTGKTMDRPGWLKLESAFARGEVTTICCWRLDRLGRTAKGLTALFAELHERKVNLVSLKEGIDLSTPAGRMMANVIASMAQYETEVRAERALAGQAAARAAGKTWGGSKPGRRLRLTTEKERTIRTMHKAGESVAAIARAVEMSRPTVYGVLAR
ncbi:recombinase family protein [Lacipirellula sp.]|uniref:recombinase family protein n=1 Tax=Lacipirellula sp. TaxID=2691419 RepID=UPI003D14ED08